MDYEVSEAQKRDVETLVRLSSALFLEDAGTRDPLTDVGWPGKHGRDHFSSLVSRDDAVCFLARSDRMPVGYLAGLIRSPTALRPVKIAEIQSMYVGREVRNRGVGSKLVEKFLFWAEGQMVGRISVTAYASNEEALRFYARHGFLPKSTTLEMPL